MSQKKIASLQAISRKQFRLIFLFLIMAAASKKDTITFLTFLLIYVTLILKLCLVKGFKTLSKSGSQFNAFHIQLLCSFHKTTTVIYCV